MSVNPVPSSNSHGNLDEEIAQLMQCKPLSDQEVNFSSSICFKFSFLALLLVGNVVFFGEISGGFGVSTVVVDGKIGV